MIGDRSLVQRNTPALWDPVRRQLERIFHQIVFNPVVETVRRFSEQGADLKIVNAKGDDDALRAALRLGRIQYSNGTFSGEFSAAISRSLRAIGAKRDVRENVYHLEPSQVPPWIRAESGAYALTAESAHRELKRTLSAIQDNLDQAVAQHGVHAQRTIDKMEDGWSRASERLRVSPRLASDSRERLAADYNQNMKLWIKKFSEEMIEDLRSEVEKNAVQGYRFDKLVGQIQGRFGVAKNKANFLARQETGLFMAKFRRERFGEAGVTQYVWRGVDDGRERPDHIALNGRVFSYDDPPIVDKATGRRANPGEDFNCRCVDEPILPPA